MVQKKIVKVWTDGGCFPNPGKGGWGWTTLDGQTGFGGMNPTTNNVMEIMAVIEAIQALYKPEISLVVYSDSQYVIHGITDWVKKWERNNWTGKKNLKNKELWKRLRQMTLNQDIRFEWVKGHSGDPGNEAADGLAKKGSGASDQEIRRCEYFYNRI